jgi:hypothetical protein
VYPVKYYQSPTPKTDPCTSPVSHSGRSVSGHAAKNDAVFHSFSMNAFYIRFEANGTFYAGLQNAIVRFWVVKLNRARGVARSGKGTPVLGSGIFIKNLRRLAIFPNIFSVGDFSA